MHVTLLYKLSSSNLISQVLVPLFLSVLKFITSHTIWNWESTDFLHVQGGPLHSTGALPFCALLPEIKMKLSHYATVVKGERHQKPIFGRKNCGYLSRLNIQSVVLASAGEPERLKTWHAIGRQLPSLWRVNIDHTPKPGYRKQTQNIDLESEILNKCTNQFKVWIRKIKYNSLKSYTVLLPYFWLHYWFLLFSFAVLTWWFAQTSSWY